jgi:hypothetical protein
MKQYLLVFMAFISPLFPLALLVTFACLIDTFVGRWYAKKTNQEVTSRKTRIGFMRKIIIYFTALVFSYLVDRFIINEIMRNYIWFDWAFTKFISSVLIWIEYTSVDEKIKWIKGKGITDRIVEFANGLKKIIGFGKDLDPRK